MTQQDFIKYMNNPANYKITRKKQYSIWACMPPVGTKVRNKLELCDYIVAGDKRIVLSGTRGEMQVVTLQKLASTYTFANGTPIKLDELAGMMQGGCIDWFKITTRVGANQETNFACFVPKRITFSIPLDGGGMLQGNAPGISHGKGDFILTGSHNLQPDLRWPWVVNGEVFADTYDNRGFTNVLERSGEDIRNIPRPKSLIPSMAGSHR